MSKGKQKFESKSNVKIRTPEQIKRYIDIETYDLGTIDRIASRTNSSFYCILHFETEDLGSTESISMSGQEMDAVVDDKSYRDILEFSLKVIKLYFRRTRHLAQPFPPLIAQSPVQPLTIAVLLAGDSLGDGAATDSP